MSSRFNTRHLLTTLLLPAALVACDDGSTGPEFESRGTVSAQVTDENSSSLSSADGSSRSAARSSSFSGMASGRAHVEIWSETEGWVMLGSPAEANVALQSSSRSTLHSNVEVASGSYSRVRLVMEGFDASIAAGAVLSGFTLDSSATIRIGGSDGRVVIEKEVEPFTVNAEATANVVFDLNSEAWVDQESAESETASDSEVESASRADVERS